MFNRKVKNLKKFGLTGCPLIHSKSPEIHEALFKISGVSAVYNCMEIAAHEWNEGVKNLKKLSGFNITIPYKTQIIPHLDKLDEKAELFGAVNTVKCEDGMCTGYNTDCYGFLRSLENAGIKLSGDVLLLGAGGVARMFAFESVLANANLTIAARNMEKANNLCLEIKKKTGKSVKAILFSEIKNGYDLIINATPVGMFPNVDECAIDEEIVKKSKAVFDSIYNPRETKLISIAKKSGIKYLNGLPMLVWQAAVAQEIWNDVSFSKDDVKNVVEMIEGN